MFSNFLEENASQISSRHCYIMADFLEAQAAHFRRLAEEKHRQKFDNEEAEKDKFEQTKMMMLAGKMALELVNDGINKNQACDRIATLTGVKSLWVAENYKKSLFYQTRDERHHRGKQILVLAQKGHTVRDIAQRLKTSKTTVSNAIRREDFIKTNSRGAQTARKKGIRAHEIANTLKCNVNDVFEMLERRPRS